MVGGRAACNASVGCGFASSSNPELMTTAVGMPFAAQSATTPGTLRAGTMISALSGATGRWSILG